MELCAFIMNNNKDSFTIKTKTTERSKQEMIKIVLQKC